MITLEFKSYDEAKEIYRYLKQIISKDMLSAYFTVSFREEEDYCFKFTLGYDEEEKEYSIDLSNREIQIECLDEYFDYKDIAFIMYPISELLLEF